MASLFDMHITDTFREAENNKKLKVIRDELVLQRALFIAAEKHRVGLTTDEQYGEFIKLVEKETNETLEVITKGDMEI